ncbi:Polysaccharide biosynthesis/export protein [Roseimaritima multifibrata]|uniref:Polysaccharide biosynthesis/export protein n=1 Tax=Roseimaritima multifibrata TaxID=1930274 RepID=A0A517MMG5_9BACT|nr:polysaccharide biosynthesis/export family protein [Roseimaritima multifibrata]QDS96066.1 Polysaccharide biosynthesis/export protein [Roseimaritima multifibrata]
MIRHLQHYLLLTMILGSLGCQTLHQHKNTPVIVQPADVPKELCKATIPEYVIEPPDILTIDALRVLPKQPYALQPLDSISVQINKSNGEPLFNASASIDPAGELPLGPEFGSVKASGKTIGQLRTEIKRLVNETYSEPLVGVDLVQIALLQQIAGEHIVSPDGKVNLGVYGQVRVAGMSIPESKQAIEAHLSTYLDKPQIAVDIFGFNSKFYYVISEGGGLGDQVTRIPFTGNETVLDAISNVEGLSAVSSKQMWVARPGRNMDGGEQVLPVDWQAVSMRGDTRTNYQIMPGDRVFVAEDKLVAFDNHFAKQVAPIERMAGVVLLVTQAAQRLVYFEQSGTNGGNSGF